jgi:hypothetical protein
LNENFYSMAGPGQGFFEWRVDCIYSSRSKKTSAVRVFELQ